MQVDKMNPVFPMLVLLSNPIVPSAKAKGHLITEEQYFSKDVDRLSHLTCPTCNTYGELFMGFFFMQCKACQNLYLSDKDDYQVYNYNEV